MAMATAMSDSLLSYAIWFLCQVRYHGEGSAILVAGSKHSPLFLAIHLVMKEFDILDEAICSLSRVLRTPTPSQSTRNSNS